jgi:hypothetical protein
MILRTEAFVKDNINITISEIIQDQQDKWSNIFTQKQDLKTAISAKLTLILDTIDNKEEQLAILKAYKSQERDLESDYLNLVNQMMTDFNDFVKESRQLIKDDFVVKLPITNKQYKASLIESGLAILFGMDLKNLEANKKEISRFAITKIPTVLKLLPITYFAQNSMIKSGIAYSFLNNIGNANAKKTINIYDFLNSCIQGNLSEVKETLNIVKDDEKLLKEILTQTDKHGQSPLSIASATGHEKVVEAILNIAKDDKELLALSKNQWVI